MSLPTSSSRVLVAAAWNHSDLTRRFLHSLRQSLEQSWHLVLVDNGSTDDTSQVVEEFLHELRTDETLSVECLKNDKNLGCAKAWNRGIRWAQERDAQWIGILNNDLVFTRGWDTRLLQFAARCGDQHPVFSPHVLSGNLHDFDQRARTFMKKNRHRTRWKLQSEAMFFNAKIFTQLGLFDERFFVSFEDFDLFLRLEAIGVRPITTGSAVVWHQEKSSRRDLPGHEQEAQKIFIEKWGAAQTKHPGFVIPRWRRRLWRWKDRFGIL